MVLNDKKVVDELRKLTLQNAVKHEGKAAQSPVVSGILGEFPDLKNDMKLLMAEIGRTVKEINSMSFDAQKNELLKIDAHALDKKEHKIDLFGFLGINENESVKTAFPPGPEKYPHIGHAKALIINYELAQRYNGKFCLRFEDTNPELVKAEFYDIMQDDFKWLGVTWDELVHASDYMALYYKHCSECIEKGNAYVCTCSAEEVKLSREKMVSCECSNRTKDDNLDFWKKMPEMNEGTAIVRLKIDIAHKNTTMRDPTAFRIIKKSHARHEYKYSVWPTYDFQNSVMDGYFKITHRLRSKEFEMRNELQRYIQRMLGYSETKIYEFARFNLVGVESSGRIIREKIQAGELLGWDDPSLTTLTALRRRGFQPGPIKEFLLKTGITKNEALLTWDDLILLNKRFLDDSCNRYFFVENPVKIKIQGAPKKSFELDKHHKLRTGGRIFDTDEFFYISSNDHDNIVKDNTYRLIECLNFKKTDEKNGETGVFRFVDESVDTFKKQGKSMMHYLPCNSENIPVEIMMPDKTIRKGLAEQGVKLLNEGDIVQFERFGYARLDDKNKMRFWFTH